MSKSQIVYPYKQNPQLKTLIDERLHDLNNDEFEILNDKYGLSKNNIKNILYQGLSRYLPSTTENNKLSMLGGTRQDYDTLEAMMKNYNIKDIRSLIQLSDKDLQSLIAIIQLHDGKVKLDDLLTNIPDENDKIKFIINELAKKLCRCIDKMSENKSNINLKNSQKIAMCIKSIFLNKGITISTFRCTPIPMLLPKKGSTFVIKYK